MPFCASCGSAVEGRFCAKCGTPLATAAPAGSAPPPPPGVAYQPAAATTGMSDNVASAICYVLFAGIIFLLIEPYNRNKTVRFHAFQGLFFFLAATVIRIVLAMTLTMIGLWTMFSLLSLVSLAFFCIWLWLVISAYQGKTVVLPVIGQLAQQQA